MSRVIVVLDRGVVETTVEMNLISRGHSSGCQCSLCQVRNSIRAALDTDRDELIERVARALYREGHGGLDSWGLLRESGGEGGIRGMYRSKARAVLAAIEGEGETNG